MKLQSAIEYLSTYGWAILILSIVAVVFFTFLNLTASSPQECVLPAGLSCQNYFMTQNGLLTLNLFQSTSNPIGITAIGCTNPQSLANVIPVNAITNPPDPLAIHHFPRIYHFIFAAFAERALHDQYLTLLPLRLSCQIQLKGSSCIR